MSDQNIKLLLLRYLKVTLTLNREKQEAYGALEDALRDNQDIVGL